LRELGREPGNVPQVSDLRINAKDIASITLSVEQIARQDFSARKVLKDRRPFGRDFDPSLFDQPLEIREFLGAGMRLDIIGHEVIILDKESELRPLHRELDCFCDDPIAPRQAFLASTTPEEIQM